MSKFQDPKCVLNFTSRLKAARIAKGLSQAELATMMGMDEYVIRSYESKGLSLNPTVPKLAQICIILEVSADHLLGLK